MELESKARWNKENQIDVMVKINRNQDPELFRILDASPNKSGFVREILRAWMKEKGK